MHVVLAGLFFAMAPGAVTQVVVYPDRAQVTRERTVACDGRATARFDAIPPAADRESVRARASGGTVLGVRTDERARKDAFAGEVAELDRALRELDRERDALADLDERDAAASSLAARFDTAATAMMSREAVDAPGTKGWDPAIEVTLAAREKAASALAARAAVRRELARRRDELAKRRDRLEQAAARRELTAEVLVDCAKAGSVRVELTYLVGGAGFTPAYEARADEARGDVQLATYATVSQTTGEDWTDARVILSTAIPRQRATPPQIAPLAVWAVEHKEEKKVLARRDEQREHAEAGGLGGGGGGGGEAMKAASQGLSVQLEVAGRSDVAGDGTPARLLVGTTRLAATFSYRAVPKAMPFVFRVADLVNTAPYPLLPGFVDVFRESGLTGRHPLGRVGQGARFRLTLGIEERLHIKRTTLAEVARTEGLLGGTRRFRYAYRFELASYLERAARVDVAEHVPVSELDEVKVAIEPETRGYELDAGDGIVTFPVAIAPGEKKTFDLAFHVDVPASYDSGGL